MINSKGVRKTVATIKTQELIYAVICVSTTMAILAIPQVFVTSIDHNANAQAMTNNQTGFNKFNISLSQAILIAQKSIGNNSYAIAAFGQKTDGGITYSVILATPGTDFYDIGIDPAKGHILSSEKISQQELEKRHLEHSQKVLTEPHLMNNTFVH